MQLTNSFTVPAEPARAWAILLDVPRIAPCMPGAELTEVVDDRTYKGNAKVRVGPVSLSFAGTAQITAIDEAAHKAHVVASGSDAKGRGGAQADVDFAMVPTDLENGSAGTRVDIVTELTLSGSVAQYGRASGLIEEIARQIVDQFAGNLRELVEAEGGAPAAPAEPDTPSSQGAAAPQADAAPAQPAAAPRPAPVRANEISGISLFFRALWAILRRAFGGK
jgi:carbon monoxide dehydrogenase subunit G